MSEQYEMPGVSQEVTLGQRIQHWAEYFKGVPLDPENSEIQALRLEVETDLSAYCEILGYHCAFYGYGTRAGYDQNGEIIMDEGLLDVDDGECIGLSIELFNKNRTPRWAVAYLFDNAEIAAESVDLPNGSFIGTTALDVGYANIMPLPSTEPDMKLIDENQEHQTALCYLLDARSESLRGVLRSDEFKHLSTDEQYEMIKNFVHHVEDEVEEVQSIKHRYTVCEAGRVYVAVPNHETPHAVYKTYLEYDASEFVTSGTVIRLDTLATDRISRGRPVRIEDDLVDKEAGLCLVILPSIETQDKLGLQRDEEVFVPISGQNVSASFLDRL